MESSPSTSAPVYLSGYEINYHVGERHILKNVTVCFQPNELTAIMGPSGGGKTTLMDVLSGRAKGGRIEGKVLFGDKLMNPRELKVVANYVPQDDILYVGLTPREHLYYTAELRLPETVSKGEKEKRVDQILDALSIQECADTIVGGVELRGISGGQKKRTSVGMELVTNPSGLFLDECTTGLDSKTAEDLIRLLASLAHSGRTIMCSIHQPSPQVFKMFDRLVFLSAGNLVYDGPVSNVNPYFASIGYSVPPDENPADYIMEVVSENGPQGAETFGASWEKKKNKFKAEWTLERERALPNLAKNLDGSIAPETPPTYPTSFSKQFGVLFERSFWNYARDIWGYPFRIIMGIMGGMMLGTMYINTDNSQEDILLKEALIAMLTALAVYDHMLGSATIFPSERLVVMREYKNGYYRLLAYYGSRTVMITLSQFPYIFVLTTEMWAFSDLRAGFAHWLSYLVTTWIVAANASLLGMLIGVFVADASIANTVIPTFGMFVVMTNGFFILPDNMPPHIEAWNAVNFGTLAFENYLINEFHDAPIEPCYNTDTEVCPYGCDPANCQKGATRTNPVDGDWALNVLDYEAHDYWWNFLGSIISNLVWFAGTYYALRYRVQRI